MVLFSGRKFICALQIMLILSLISDDSLANNLKKFLIEDPSEVFPGGTATFRGKRNRNAFSQPAANITFIQQADFAMGDSLFTRLWVSSPSSTKSADGLGPLFNARSCQNCHLKDGRGHTPEGNWPKDNSVSMLLRLSIKPETKKDFAQLKSGRVHVIPEPNYGKQLQDMAVAGQNAEGRINITYHERKVSLRGAPSVVLRVPSYKITHLGYGPLHKNVLMSPRIAPPMIGLGLLELIPVEAILAQADPEDKNKDGVSGRVNLVWSKEYQKIMPGRFGWKAGQPTMNQQIQEAFNGDIGLSAPLTPSPAGDCTDSQKECLTSPHGQSNQKEDFEVTPKMLELVLFYSRHLAVPVRTKFKDKQVKLGRKIFFASGCAGCHRPGYLTGNDKKLKALSNQKIWPWSDLLLHDMGPDLADHRGEGGATGREWRTPPLWGLGATEAVSGHTQLLHDGRARNIEEAVLWHGGEALAARDHYRNLTPKERSLLLAFLNSL